MVIEIGEELCVQLNNTTSYYDSKVSVDPENFFYAEGCSFSDLYGAQTAFDELLYVLPVRDDDYYENNRKTIHSYIRPEHMTPEMAERIGAPVEELATEQQGGMEGDQKDENNQFNLLNLEQKSIEQTVAE